MPGNVIGEKLKVTVSEKVNAPEIPIIKEAPAENTKEDVKTASDEELPPWDEDESPEVENTEIKEAPAP